jgi:hypothetical protein
MTEDIWKDGTAHFQDGTKCPLEIVSKEDKTVTYKINYITEPNPFIIDRIEFSYQKDINKGILVL